MSGIDDAARTRERRWVFWLGLVVAAVLPVGVVVGVLVTRSEDTDPEPVGPATWALLIGLPIGLVLAVAAGTAVLVLWRRRRGSPLFARSPLWELSTQKQRRHLVRALRRGDTIDPEHHDLALRTARDVTRRRGILWLDLGVGLVQTANVVVQEGASRWLSLAGAVIFLGLAGYWAWLIHRMHLAVRRLETAP